MGYLTVTPFSERKLLTGLTVLSVQRITRKKQTNSNDDDNNKMWIFVDQDYSVISQFLAFGNICASTPVARVFSFLFSLMRCNSSADIETKNKDTSHIYRNRAW